MAPAPLDTQPELEEMRMDGLRHMPAWRKLALAGEMSQAVRSLALAGVRQRYPQETPGQQARRLADLLLGSDLARRACGPPPEEEGCSPSP